MATDLDAARIELRRIPVAPFQAWRIGRPVAATIREADNDLQNGWVREADRELVELAAPYPWETRGAPAIAAREMQSWAMLDALLVAHSATGSWAYLEVAVELAEDWTDHGAQARDAWQPPAPAHRAHRLAYVVHAAAVEDALDMSRWRKLARLAERHGRRLKKESGGIDGLLAALGRVSLHERLGSHLGVGDVPDLAVAIDDCVDARGAVASSSTADHVTVATALAAVDAGTSSLDLTSVRRPIEDALAWLVTTDGHPANFGATALEPVSGSWRGGDVATQELVAPLVSDQLAFALSAGAEGLPPAADTRYLRGAGLTIAKPVWTSYGEPGAFVAVDRSGSIVWHDAGHAILVAPGTTDEALAGATSDRIARGIEWLRDARPNGLAMEPQPPLVDHASRVGVINESIFFDVSTDFEGLHTRRSVVVDPGRWLFVADWVTADSPVTAEQAFLLGPGLDAFEQEDMYVVAAADTPLVWAAAIHGSHERSGIRRGGRNNAAGGWWAPRPGRIAPATQIGWTGDGAHLLMAVVFSLLGPVHPVAAGEWSFAFVVADRTTHLTLGPLGLVDAQETT